MTHVCRYRLDRVGGGLDDKMPTRKTNSEKPRHGAMDVISRLKTK